MLRSPVVRGSSLTSSAQSVLRCQRCINSRPISFIAPYSSQQSSSATQSPGQQQKRQAHAISNPTLANIEKRWEAMPLQEQADLWMQLKDRMKVDWHDLTLAEKKAAYWIAFGPHGPRAVDPPGTNWKIFTRTLLGVGIAGVIFAFTHHFARPGPRTMTKEYQLQMDERMKAQKAEPISGWASQYGATAVQSPPEAQAHVQKAED